MTLKPRTISIPGIRSLALVLLLLASGCAAIPATQTAPVHLHK